MPSSTVLKRRSRCPSNLLLSAASPFSALSSSQHEPATEPAKWCSASLTSLFPPFSALLEVPSSRRDPPNAIAHRVHIRFQAEAVIALGDRLGALSDGVEQGLGTDQVGRLVEDGIVEIGIGALARLVLAKRLFGLIEGHLLPPGQGLGLKAADKPVSSRQLGIGKRVLT